MLLPAVLFASLTLVQQAPAPQTAPAPQAAPAPAEGGAVPQAPAAAPGPRAESAQTCRAAGAGSRMGRRSCRSAPRVSADRAAGGERPPQAQAEAAPPAS